MNTAAVIKPPAIHNDPKPTQLIRTYEEIPPYPLEALGHTLSNAAQAFAAGVQVPAAMAAQSVLAAAALAAQPHADVVVDGRKYPINLFCMTIAESGERKSSLDRLAIKPHTAHQRALVDESEEELQRYTNELEAYEICRRKTINSNKGEDQEVIAGALHELGSPPVQPKNPQLLSQEPTIEGLVKSLAGGYPSQGVFNDEAGSLFGGYGFSNEQRVKSITTFSQLWDGRDIHRSRAGAGESMMVQNPRVSAHLMMQPIIAAPVLSNPEMQHQGFLARFLIAHPKSVQGTRLYQEIDLTIDKRVKMYDEKLSALLSLPPPTNDNGTLTPRELPLSKEAKQRWIDAYNAIEKQLAPNGSYDDIRETANKMAANILRLAGVLTIVENSNAVNINCEILEQAVRLGSWYLQEMQRLCRKADENKDCVIAQGVMDWIQSKNHKYITVDMINKNKVKRLNSSKRCREVINLLEQHDHLIPIPEQTEIDGKRVREAWRLNRWLSNESKHYVV